MTATSECMLVLTEAERKQLELVLGQVLRDKQVESHRTDSLTYKEVVEREEGLVRSILDKVRRLEKPATSPAGGS